MKSVAIWSLGFPFALCVALAFPTQAEEPAAVRTVSQQQRDEDSSQLVKRGNSYLNGEGAHKDPAKARELFQAAADLGSAEGKGLFGFMLAEGLGGPRDEREAVRWMREAAEAGLASARFNFGGMLEAGRGVPQDVAAALAWYEQAAAQEYSHARLKLANLYYLGAPGIGPDHAKALPHVRIAATAGNPWAQNCLGTMFEFGQATKPNLSLARHWYRMAAEQGDAKAQSNLGRMFRYGSPDGKDPVLAYKWLKLSAMQGEVTAQMLLKDFAPIVSDRQKREAEDRIARFMAKRSAGRVGPGGIE
jgi:TPR repeat protein